MFCGDVSHFVIFESTNELEVVPEMKKNPFVQDDEESDDERQETSSLPSPPRTGTAKTLPHLSPLLSRSLNAGKSGNERTAISECE
ncbi:hypothetical protein MHYP_G00364980 [Metynnis hypsauchen]